MAPRVTDSRQNSVQRTFTYASKVIEEPLFILRYLLESGRLASNNRGAIQDFIAKAGTGSAPTKGLRKKRQVENRQSIVGWLRKHKIQGTAGQILSDAYDWAKSPSELISPATRSSGEETESAAMEFEQDEEGSKELLFGEIDFGEEEDEEDQQDSSFTQQDAMEFEQQRSAKLSKEKLELEKDGDRIGEQLPAENPLLVITWNLEKYGRVQHTQAVPHGADIGAWSTGVGENEDFYFDEDEDLESWTEIGADHLPVLTVIHATVSLA